MSFPSVIHGSFGDQFEERTAQGNRRLGTVLLLPDGRRFVYVQMGTSVAGVAGSLYESEAKTANWANENPTAAVAAGKNTVSVDIASAITAKDYFKDGFLIDETNGHTYSIKSNTKSDPTILVLNESLETDLATGDVVSMFASPFKQVVIKVAAKPAAPVVGVCTQIIATDSFGWLQTYGLCGVLAEGTLIVGDKCVASVLNDAGAVEAATADLGQVVGNVLEIGVDQEIAIVFLTLG